MKSLQLLGSLALAVSALAQTFNIVAPHSVTIGQPYTVTLEQPANLGPLEQISVIIGLQGCGSSACPIVDNDEILGQILFHGDFNPVRHASEPERPPYQNFTFTLSSTAQPGYAVIHVANLFLSGAGPNANLITKNVSVTLSHPGGAKFRRVGL